MRKAVFSGLFYPADKGKLLSLLEGSFIGDFGPQSLPILKNNSHKTNVKAVIVPHAGYSFSGMAAAHAFKFLAEQKMPDLFILLGPNHSSFGSGICDQDYETPLGVVKTDIDCARLFSEGTSLKINNKIHEREHSLEVQMPFLQFVFKDRLSKLRILPIILSHDVNFDVLASEMSAVLKDLDKSVVFIVSSDFTHYGPNYDYVPFRGDIKKNLEILDKGAFDLIIKKDYVALEKYVDKTGMTMCGIIPVLLLLRMISFNKAEVRKYYVSGDVVGDYNNSVSYAAISFSQ